MYVLLRHHVFLYLKFYVLFCFFHHSLFNVSFLHLFINVSRGISQKLGEKGVISQHKIPTFSSTCMYLYITMCDVFLYLTFIYLLYLVYYKRKELLTLGKFCFIMIGRADIEGSKRNVAMNACYLGLCTIFFTHFCTNF